MLAWVGLVFAVVLLAGCMFDAVLGATAEALAEAPPIETLDGTVRSVEAANDDPTAAWSADARDTRPTLVSPVTETNEHPSHVAAA